MSAAQLVGLARAVDGREIGAVDLDRAPEAAIRELELLDTDRLLELLCRVEVPA